MAPFRQPDHLAGPPPEPDRAGVDVSETAYSGRLGSDGIDGQDRAVGAHRDVVVIVDTDPGARSIGEFSLGFNPYIQSPMCDILFDEKIAGSLHFTPGQA